MEINISRTIVRYNNFIIRSNVERTLDLLLARTTTAAGVRAGLAVAPVRGLMGRAWGCSARSSVAPAVACFAFNSSLCRLAAIIAGCPSSAYMASFEEESAVAHPAVRRPLNCLRAAGFGPDARSSVEARAV